MDPKTVLLVDPDVDSRAICTAILEHHGYRVLQATNGADGLRIAREMRPDLVLTELSIPILDGWTVIHALKRDPLTAHLPVATLTVVAFPADRDRASAAGCVGYLVKPIEPRRLVEEVRSWIGPDAAQPA